MRELSEIVPHLCPRCRCEIKYVLQRGFNSYQKIEPLSLFVDCQCPGVSISFSSDNLSLIDLKPNEYEKWSNAQREYMLNKVRKYFAEHDWQYVIEQCDKIKEAK